MSNLTNLSGEPISAEKKVTVILDYEPASGRLAIGGELDNLDRVLSILAQATRHFESEYRNQKALAFRAQIEQDKQILSRLT